MITGGAAKPLPLALALVGPACIFDDNPLFESGRGAGDGDGDGDGDGGPGTGPATGPGTGSCEPGTLDCDAEPGCETDASDPITCGSCEHRCIIDDRIFSCDQGVCSGTLEFTALADTYVDSSLATDNFGAAPTLEVGVGDSVRVSFIALPELEPLLDQAELQAAILYLNCIGAGATVYIDRVEMQWSELELTWLTAPVVFETQQAKFNPSAGDTLVDLTAMLGAPDLPYGLVLWTKGDNNGGSGVDGAGGSRFASTQSEQVPRLRVDLSW